MTSASRGDPAAGGASAEPIDVLDRTFAELVAECRPRAHEQKKLRAAYQQLLRGAAPDVARDGRLVALVLPVVREVRTGELTKFVQRTADALEIESVVVPMERVRGTCWTLCVSSQIGCARGCAFCETAQLGLLRNLTPAEIVGQVVAAHRYCPEGVRNVVFMGMGEPLDNFDAVERAIRILTDPHGLSFAFERISISTAGRCAGIRRLAALGWRRLNLAVSLNAPNDELRSRLMPINRQDSLADLAAALGEYPVRRNQFFMMEYVLIPGVNDAPEHARQVADYLRPLPAVLNVIPYNPRGASPWPAPEIAAVESFVTQVRAAGQLCTARITKGRDHMAACGQLGNRALSRSATDSD